MKNIKKFMLTLRIENSEIERLDAVAAVKHPGKTRGAVIREILAQYIRKQEAATPGLYPTLLELEGSVHHS